MGYNKKAWIDSLELLKELLKTKKKELVKLKQDLQEIEFSIQCYKRKIGPYTIEKLKKTPIGVN